MALRVGPVGPFREVGLGFLGGQDWARCLLQGFGSVAVPSSDLADRVPFRGTGKVVLRYVSVLEWLGVVPLLALQLPDLSAYVLLRLAS